MLESQSSAFKSGDRVFGSTVGSFATKLSINHEHLRRIPSELSFSDAAGLPATLPVAYGALVDRAAVRPGETVLIHGASGGIGLMCIQVAKALGPTVIAACSPAKFSATKQYGADHCIDYGQEKWWEKVTEITDGRGVDVVIDNVGLVDGSLKCIAHGGRIVIVGFAGGKWDNIAMNRVLLKQASLLGYVSSLAICSSILSSFY